MPQQRAVIFANGDVTDLTAVAARVHPGDWLIAADGGMRHLRALGLTPALLIGDLDSVDPVERSALEARGTRLQVHPTDKDETDLELALLHARAQGAREILVVGAFGGRLDHTLANVALLALPELQACAVCLTDGPTDAVLVRGTLHLHGRVGDHVSLLPIGDDALGVRTNGLRFPLRGERLACSRSRGISNELTATEAVVSLESGLLLCILTRRREPPAATESGKLFA
jgi:thiamine pyrophosphokinase